MTVLAKHVHQPPDSPHRLIALDAARIRCLDCLHTLDLRPGAVPDSTSTSTTSPPALHAPDRCNEHPGQRHGACGPCRAEQLEARRVHEHRHRPTADVAAGAAAARAALTAVTSRRAAADTTEEAQ